MADSLPPPTVIAALRELAECGHDTSSVSCKLLHRTLCRIAQVALGGVHAGARLEPQDLAADVLLKLIDRVDLGDLKIEARSERQAVAYLRRCVYHRGLDVLERLSREQPDELDDQEARLATYFDEERSEDGDVAAIVAFYDDIEAAFRAHLSTIKRAGGADNLTRAYTQLFEVCRGEAGLADFAGSWSSRNVMDRHMSNARRAVRNGISLLEKSGKIDTERADQLRVGFRLLYVHGRRGRAAVRQNC